MNSINITVFTPTWNREYTLPKVYDCLKRQTIKNFEWVIVDDGSTDGTQDMIQAWINGGGTEFPIRLITQQNSGKHVAQNRALEIAEGELFLPLDSDDTIVENALEILWREWKNIPGDERKKYSGIGVHCMDGEGNRIGTPWPNEACVSNDLEITFKYRVIGEKWGPIRTDIMKKYKNPEVKGHYLSESTVWYRIAKEYQKLYIDEKLRYYEIGNDSVQKKKHFADNANAESKMCSSLIYINEFWDWYRKYNIKGGIVQALIGTKAAVESGSKVILGKNSYFHQVSPLIAKVAVLVASPYKLVYMLRKQEYHS